MFDYVEATFDFVERAKFQRKTRSTLLPFLVTMSNVASTLLLYVDRVLDSECVLPARHQANRLQYSLAVLARYSLRYDFVSVYISVTNRSTVETAERIELVFLAYKSYSQPVLHSVLREFGHLEK